VDQGSANAAGGIWGPGASESYQVYASSPGGGGAAQRRSELSGASHHPSELRQLLAATGIPGGFADPNARHPALALAGGAIADFLPHLASLAHRFIGAHRRAQAIWTKRKVSILPYDEFHGVVEGERGTATLGFSATAQPDAFWLRVFGERAQASTNLFETRLTFERLRDGPKPLQPLKNGLEEGKAVRRAAIGTLMRKFKPGPGAYDGMWHLLAETYGALARGTPLPIPIEDVLAVNRMVEALKPVEAAS